MSKTTRILVATASLALLLVYFFPMWTISLDAPQYPEGLGMEIWVSDIVGQKPNDLKNINGLNHYIGMKEIRPDSIPELRFMPWIVAFLSLSGLLVAALGRRRLLYAWTGVFVAVALAGLADFWWWEYDYGHNLDAERAIIKIPGMSYQPPLIGSKQILNFKATAWPGIGGMAAILAGILATVAAGLEVLRARRGGRSEETGAMPVRTVRVAAGVGLAALVAEACSPEPRPIVLGEDVCAGCHMVIADARFAGELVATTGKVHTFDSVECLVAYTLEPGVAGTVHSLWVTPFDAPGELIPAAEAFYLRSPELRSPMGMSLAAFGPGTAEGAALDAFGGEILTWDEVVATVEAASREGSGHGAAGHPHGVRSAPGGGS